MSVRLKRTSDGGGNIERNDFPTEYFPIYSLDTRYSPHRDTERNIVLRHAEFRPFSYLSCQYGVHSRHLRAEWNVAAQIHRRLRALFKAIQRRAMVLCAIGVDNVQNVWKSCCAHKNLNRVRVQLGYDLSPYSPDPNDYRIVPKMTSSIASEHRFANNENLMNGVNRWPKTLAASFFREGMEKLVPRYKKRVELNGDCAKK